MEMACGLWCGPSHLIKIEMVAGPSFFSLPFPFPLVSKPRCPSVIISRPALPCLCLAFALALPCLVFPFPGLSFPLPLPFVSSRVLFFGVFFRFLLVFWVLQTRAPTVACRLVKSYLHYGAAAAGAFDLLQRAAWLLLLACAACLLLWPCASWW